MRGKLLLLIVVGFPSMRILPENSPTLVMGDAIYVHGNIYTGVVGNPAFPEVERASAMALRGDRILEVGNEPDILRHRDANTLIFDLKGAFVMPGFNDSHLHLALAGAKKLNVDLTGVSGLEEFRQRVAAKVNTAQTGEWILGGGWDETLWRDKIPPSRWDLDEVSSGHPVILDRVDEHIAVANTRALQMAKITLATRDPEGGHIDRTDSGEPTGILRDTAKEAVLQLIPKPTHQRMRRGIEGALADLAAHGVTSAQDFSPDWEYFQIFEELEREGRLTTRISEWLPFEDSVDELRRKRDSHSQSDLMLRTGMLKAYMDGSLGGRTAALLAPYADDPRNPGLPRYEPARLNAMAKERILAGFQLGFHAIGDRGVQLALDALAEAENAARDRGVAGPQDATDFRLRIEHAQVTTAEQIDRFKVLKVIASMQPSQLLTDMRWAVERLGPKRAATSYAWAAFIKQGVLLAFGTDYPVEPVDPFRGLYAAVTRRSEDGKQEYFPGQRLTIDQAIAAYTAGAAFAEFREKDKGALKPGLLADFVVLDRDPTAIPAEQVLGTRVLQTIVGGKTVFEQN